MRTFKFTGKVSTPLLVKIVAGSDASSLDLRICDVIQLHEKNTCEFGALRILSESAPLENYDIVFLAPSGHGFVTYENRSLKNSILLTERCNCHCLSCPQPPKKADDGLTYDIALGTIKLLGVETKSIGITGGEPTLEWERLINLLGTCKERMSETSIQVLTNGRVMRDYTKAEELASIGLNNLYCGVPLYSDVDSIHDYYVGSKGAFWETIEGLYNLERYKIPVELRIVITQLNSHRLTDWAKFVYKSFPFVRHIAFMGLELEGYASKNFGILHQQPQDYMTELLSAVKILRRRDMPLSIFNHQLCMLPKELWPFSRQSITDWKVYYPDDCSACNFKQGCGGFFSSSIEFRPQVKPIGE